MSLEFSKNPLVDKISKIFKFLANNKKTVGLYALGLLVFIGLVAGYFVYRSGVQRRAHKDFLIAMDTFNAKIVKTVTNEKLPPNVFGSEKDKWEHVDKVFDEMYKKNKSAGIASVFLAYRVEALLSLGQLSDAIKVQNLLLKHIPAKSALRTYNNIKLALMQIDTSMEEYVNTGLYSLRNIAYEQGNVSQDEALYRLGEYYWNSKDFKEAANYWSQLEITFGKTAKYPSALAGIARTKLKTITA